MAGFVEVLRSGAWLTRERMRLIAATMLVAGLLGAGYLLATAHGINDRLGRPLGTDYSNVYAAGTYVLDGMPAAPFDPVRQYAREQAIFGAATQFYGWHYPPFFLGLAALLALLPYLWSLAVWQGTTLALYLLSIRSILFASRPPPRPQDETGTASGRLWLLLALAFPAVFINLGQGHNGFLTAALFAAALTQLDRRPLLAGLLFGLIVYKPQFGLLIPVVLAASGRWRSFAAAAATVVASALVVSLVFGNDVWSAFLASTGFTRHVVLEQGDTGWYKIQSVFSWVRLWGGSVALAYVAQAIVTSFIIVALGWLWHGKSPFALKAAALLIGTLLATPYSLDYDLMLLAPAIAYLGADGMTRGFAPWQKTILAGLWIVPLIARSVPQMTLIPLAVPLMLVAFLFLLRRAINDGAVLHLWIFAPRALK